MSPITTVIFDMYETLVQNPGDLWKLGFEDIISGQSLPVDADRLWQEWWPGELEFRANRIIPGAAFRTYRQSWRDCFAQAFDRLGVTGDPEVASDTFLGYIARREPFPETKEALRAVQRQWRTAVLSNADDAYLVPNLDRLGLEFEAVLSSEEARVYKPLPGIFQTLLCKLELEAEEAVYVGDRQLEDVQGASRVGISAIWINRSGAAPDPELPEPSCQIRSLLELPQVLQAWPSA
jgi:2-haloalkanoic acid dehalogenase type II